MLCKNCGEQIGDNDAECPRCGEATGNQPQSHYRPPQYQQYQQPDHGYQQPNFQSPPQQPNNYTDQIFRLLFEYYIDVFRKYFDFSGRARRTEYWTFYVFNMIIMAIPYTFYFVGIKIQSAAMVMICWPLISLFALAILIPGIAVTVRRLHDVGKSGFWYFIAFVPCIGGIWLLVLLVTAGNTGWNQYGADPKYK